MSNYSVLQQNTLAGLSDGAGKLYLDLCDRYQAHKSDASERRAFLEASRYDERVGGVIDHILRNYPCGDLPSETITSLSQFFADRYRHNFMQVAA